jgi:hypothetical protein
MNTATDKQSHTVIVGLSAAVLLIVIIMIYRSMKSDEHFAITPECSVAAQSYCDVHCKGKIVSQTQYLGILNNIINTCGANFEPNNYCDCMPASNLMRGGLQDKAWRAQQLIPTRWLNTVQGAPQTTWGLYQWS